MKQHPWQQNQWQRLVRQYQLEKFPHALLFNGEQSLGSKHFALILSQFLFCKDSDKLLSKQSCGKCSACNLFRNQTHPDFFLIEPDENSNAIKIAQIRNFSEQFKHSASQADAKIACISHAETMNQAASNAFLKTLEEPIYQKSIFILLTEQTSSVTATIRSRCQTVIFNTPNKLITKQWLQEQSIQSEHDFDEAYQLAQGSPLKLLENLTNESSELSFKQLLIQHLKKQSNHTKALEKFIKKSPVAAIEVIQYLCYEMIQQQPQNTNKNDAFFKLWDNLNQTKNSLHHQIPLNLELLLETYIIQIRRAIKC